MHRSDRAEKKAYGPSKKMRMALLETHMVKQMRVNDNLTVLFSPKLVMKMRICETFREQIPGELSDVDYFRCLLTRKHRLKKVKESQHSSQMKKFTTSETKNKQTGGQENNFTG